MSAAMLTASCEGLKLDEELSYPLEVTVTASVGVDSDNARFLVRWQPPAQTRGAELEYQYDLDGLGDWNRMGRTPPHSIMLTHRKKWHMVRVRAVDIHGKGEPSPGVFAMATDKKKTYGEQKCSSSGSGSRARPYVICSYHQLKNIPKLAADANPGIGIIRDLHFKLGAHIDATDSYEEGPEGCSRFYPTYEPTKITCTGWKPLPSFVKSHFDGNNRIIAGLYGHFTDQQHSGFISQLLSHSSVKNVHLRNIYFFSPKKSPAYIGGIVGSVESSRMENTSVVGGRIHGLDKVGGIAGQVGTSDDGSRLMNIYAGSLEGETGEVRHLKVYGHTVGGLVGRVSGSTLHSVASKVHVTGRDTASKNVFAGGAIGQMGGSRLEFAVAKAKVQSSDYAGGLVGKLSTSFLSKTIVYGVQGVKGNRPSLVGSVAGLYEESSSSPPQDNFYEAGIANQSASTGSVGTELTTRLLQCQEASCLFGTEGFTFSDDDNEGIHTGSGYPEPKICIRNCPCNFTSCDQAKTTFSELSIFDLPDNIR